MSKELESIPNFEYGDNNRQVIARTRFRELGITIPMVSVHFTEIGSLRRLTPRVFAKNGKTVLTPQQKTDFQELVNRTFSYLAGSEAIALATDHANYRPPHPYWPASDGAVFACFSKDGAETLSERIRLAHNDESMAGKGAIVYGAHFTPYGSGEVEAALAAPTTKIRPGRGLRSFLPAEMTHGRRFQAGDMHIFVRQAASQRYRIRRNTRPTTHVFKNGPEGRVLIEQSFGLTRDWARVPMPFVDHQAVS